MCKKIGAIDDMNQGEMKILSLGGVTDQECANVVGQHFAEVSNQYKPLDLQELPAFLPAQPAPQVQEHEVYLKLRK